MSETKLSKVFHNLFYCGLVVSKYIEGQVIEGKHEAMVSRETFFAVRDMLKGRFEKGRHTKENTDELPLRRFVHCHECGEPYTGYLQKQKNIYYYRCRTIGCCKNRNQHDMHRSFARFIGNCEVCSKVLDHVHRMLQHVYVEQNKEI